MNIKSLRVNNFRNYTSKEIEFTSDKVVFVGENGRGKTNILEAISVFSVGKSWREVNETIQGNKKCNLIQSNNLEHESALIELETNKNDLYKIQITPRSRIFIKNQKKIPRKNHLGQIPTLLFAPEHLDIFSGSKRSRQSFFDRFICQLNPSYKELLSQTLRVIKQKNTIFREILSEGEIKTQISPWNEILQKNIPEIWKVRETFLKELEPILQSELEKISGNNDEIKIFLTRSGKNEGGFIDFSREFIAKRSLFSPTRDDFTFHYRGQSIMNTVSRGEIRSVLLALLSAKKKLFFEKTNKMPILLLDDCFSELDDNRQKGLERLCEGTQVFFTTTHDDHFSKFKGKIQKIEV